MSLTVFLHVLTAWGDVLFHLLGGSPGLLFHLYSWIYFWLFYQGWLAAPLTYLLLCLVVLLVRGTPILAGGIGVARLVVGAVFVVVFVFGQFLCQCALLVTRLG